jgi:hypothetical protein
MQQKLQINFNHRKEAFHYHLIAKIIFILTSSNYYWLICNIQYYWVHI